MAFLFRIFYTDSSFLPEKNPGGNFRGNIPKN